MRTCGSFIHWRLLVLCFFLQFYTMRIMVYRQRHAHGEVYSRNILLTMKFAFPVFTPTDETGDSNLWYAKILCAWCVSILLTISRNDLRGEGMTRLCFSFCAAQGAHCFQWWITDFSGTPAVFWVLIIKEEQKKTMNSYIRLIMKTSVVQHSPGIFSVYTKTFCWAIKWGKKDGLTKSLMPQNRSDACPIFF